MQGGNHSIIYYLNVCTCNQGAGLWNSWRSHWLRAIAGRWKLWSPSECLYFPAKCSHNPRAPCPSTPHTLLQGESQVPAARNKPLRCQDRAHRICTEDPRRSPKNQTSHFILYFTSNFILYFISPTSSLIFWHHHSVNMFVASLFNL